ncbi:DUF5071 domain-containing protein [Paenibacillus rhizoplanae]
MIEESGEGPAGEIVARDQEENPRYFIYKDGEWQEKREEVDCCREGDSTWRISMHLFKKLDWDTAEAEQAEAIQKLQDIQDEELHLLLQPLGKEYWGGAAEVIVKLGYPRVKPILPGLLQWIQDMNWPGSRRIATLLRETGDPVIPYIQDVFRNQSQDEEWMYWIFEMIIDYWNKDHISQIQEELIRLTEGKKQLL